MRRLQQLVSESLQVLAARAQTYSPVSEIREAVVNSSRLLFLAAGRVRYVIEERAIDLAAPVVLLVPAWTRRRWRVRDEAAVELLYCEFVGGFELPLVVVDRPDAPLERGSFGRLVGLSGGDQADQLCAVLELKAMLGRTLAHGQALWPAPAAANSPGGADTLIEAALALLSDRLDEPRILATARRTTHLSDEAFRRRFHRRAGMPPRDYLTLQRMRRARYLLHEQHLSVKEVAKRVGFADAFAFSRRYRVFWGHPPSAQRG